MQYKSQATLQFINEPQINFIEKNWLRFLLTFFNGISAISTRCSFHGVKLTNDIGRTQTDVSSENIFVKFTSRRSDQHELLNAHTGNVSVEPAVRSNSPSTWASFIVRFVGVGECIVINASHTSLTKERKRECVDH